MINAAIAVQPTDTAHPVIVTLIALVALAVIIGVSKFVRSELDGYTALWIVVAVASTTLGLTSMYNSSQLEATTNEAVIAIEVGYGIELLSAQNLPTVPRTSTEILIKRNADILDCTVSVDAASKYVTSCLEGGKVQLLSPVE